MAVDLDRVFPPEQCDDEVGDEFVASWKRSEARSARLAVRPSPPPWDRRWAA